MLVLEGQETQVAFASRTYISPHNPDSIMQFTQAILGVAALLFAAAGAGSTATLEAVSFYP